MARLNLSNIETNDLTLDELVPVYAETKADFDMYKKMCESQNTLIKSQLEKLGKDSHTAGGYVAKRTVSTRESINEDRLLEVLKKHNIEGIIKTREYVDMDALEKYLYNNDLSDELATDMNSCREITEVVQLRISKEKKKKEE